MKKPKKRRAKMEISVELETLMNEGANEQEQLEIIAKVYAKCFGGKDIKINSIRFLD